MFQTLQKLVITLNINDKDLANYVRTQKKKISSKLAYFLKVCIIYNRTNKKRHT